VTTDNSHVDQESETERVNRELIELLNELRVALPGVQVLFAFLLTMPFAKGFATTTPLQRDVFFLSLASAVVATILLLAPSAYHRILFRQHDKDRLLRHANSLALAGMAALAVALASSLFVVVDYVFGAPLAGVATAVCGGLIAVLWCAVPIWIRATDRTP
jgi:uncharacterized protein DUF6328